MYPWSRRQRPDSRETQKSQPMKQRRTESPQVTSLKEPFSLVLPLLPYTSNSCWHPARMQQVKKMGGEHHFPSSFSPSRPSPQHIHAELQVAFGLRMGAGPDPSATTSHPTSRGWSWPLSVLISLLQHLAPHSHHPLNRSPRAVPPQHLSLTSGAVLLAHYHDLDFAPPELGEGTTCGRTS